MARPGSTALLLALVLACLLIAGPHAVQAITCGRVITYLIPCLSYAQGMGPLNAECCSGVRGLNDTAQTTADRQTTCNCLKSSAASAQGSLQFGLISGIPSKCGVPVPYGTSPSTDCSRVR